MNEGTHYDLTETGWVRPPEPPLAQNIFLREQQVRFGPGKPVMPDDAEEQPRVFAYPAGVNLSTLPRAGFGLASFSMLRALAAACKEIRLNIELIKREIRALEWDIVPRTERDPDTQAYRDDIQAARRFLDMPDGIHDFDQWLNILLEDLLAVDATAIWPELDAAGNLAALELIDGTTIRPLLDARGRIAPPPLPAYIQNIHGMPMSHFTRNRLIYRPFNAVSYSPYGTSPIEFILLVVNLALRRDTYRVAYFTDGNVPEALIGAPSSWTQPQIQTWQEYWDAMVAGKISQLRKMHFVPLEAGRGSLPIHEFNRSDPDKSEMDSWLMRVAAWAYGNSPGEFGLAEGQGLGGKGWGEAMENIQYRSMLGPLTQYLSRLLSGIVQTWMHFPNLKFKWSGLTAQTDPLQQAQIDEIYIRAGVDSIDEVRGRRGQAPLGVGPIVQTPYGPVEVKPGFDEQMRVRANPFSLAIGDNPLAKADNPADDPSDAQRDAAQQAIAEVLRTYWVGLRARIVEVMRDDTRT